MVGGAFGYAPVARGLQTVNASSCKRRAFITDGSYPNALAAVRALGDAGYEVTVAERTGISQSETISFWSRHCAQRFRYPDPKHAPEETVRALREHFLAQRYDVAIPVGLEMTGLFVANRELLAVPVMLPGTDSFGIAADKRRTFEHFGNTEVPIPKTVPASHWTEIGLPVVFKHCATGAHISRDAADAEAYVRTLGTSLNEYLAQEYIPGENGYGYFGFFENGREAAFFMHQRIMQIPKEGGPSVVARAIRDDRLRTLGRSALESLDWNGVAMVEFKRSDADGDYYLMEINPKFWGSLDLAIQSGCNFPLMLANSVTAQTQHTGGTYRDGLRYQWVVPNGLKCFLRYPEFRLPFLRNLITPGVRTDVRLNDPLPTAAGLFAMASKCLR